MRHSKQKPLPNSGFSVIHSGFFHYNGDLPPPAVEVLAAMGLSESVNSELTGAIQKILNTPEGVEKLSKGTEFLYTTSPARTEKVGGFAVVIIEYSIWMK